MNVCHILQQLDAVCKSNFTLKPSDDGFGDFLFSFRGCEVLSSIPHPLLEGEGGGDWLWRHASTLPYAVTTLHRAGCLCYYNTRCSWVGRFPAFQVGAPPTLYAMRWRMTWWGPSHRWGYFSRDEPVSAHVRFHHDGTTGMSPLDTPGMQEPHWDHTHPHSRALTQVFTYTFNFHYSLSTHHADVRHIYIITF